MAGAMYREPMSACGPLSLRTARHGACALEGVFGFQRIGQFNLKPFEDWQIELVDEEQAGDGLQRGLKALNGDLALPGASHIPRVRRTPCGGLRLCVRTLQDKALRFAQARY